MDLLVVILTCSISILCGIMVGFNVLKYKIIIIASEEYNILEVKIGDTYKRYEIRRVV